MLCNGAESPYGTTLEAVDISKFENWTDDNSPALDDSYIAYEYNANSAFVYIGGGKFITPTYLYDAITKCSYPINARGAQPILNISGDTVFIDVGAFDGNFSFYESTGSSVGGTVYSGNISDLNDININQSKDIYVEIYNSIGSYDLHSKDTPIITGNFAESPGEIENFGACKPLFSRDGNLYISVSNIPECDSNYKMYYSTKVFKNELCIGSFVYDVNAERARNYDIKCLYHNLDIYIILYLLQDIGEWDYDPDNPGNSAIFAHIFKLENDDTLTKLDSLVCKDFYSGSHAGTIGNIFIDDEKIIFMMNKKQSGNNFRSHEKYYVYNINTKEKTYGSYTSSFVYGENYIEFYYNGKIYSFTPGANTLFAHDINSKVNSSVTVDDSVASFFGNIILDTNAISETDIVFTGYSTSSGSMMTCQTKHLPTITVDDECYAFMCIEE